MQIHLAVAAKDSHKSVDAPLKEVHRRFHEAASRPDGPAAPSILSIVSRIIWPFISSNSTGWGSSDGVSSLIMVESLGGCFGGFL